MSTPSGNGAEYVGINNGVVGDQYSLCLDCTQWAGIYLRKYGKGYCVGNTYTML